jgi:F0F1-type ATP synthase assembly protein I
MVVGVVSGFFMNRWIGPSPLFWIPQLIGSVVWIAMSFIIPVTFKAKKP